MHFGVRRGKPHPRGGMVFLKMNFDPDFEDMVSHSYNYFMTPSGSECQRISAKIYESYHTEDDINRIPQINLRFQIWLTQERRSTCSNIACKVKVSDLEQRLEDRRESWRPGREVVALPDLRDKRHKGYAFAVAHSWLPDTERSVGKRRRLWGKRAQIEAGEAGRATESVRCDTCRLSLTLPHGTDSHSNILYLLIVFHLSLPNFHPGSVWLTVIVSAPVLPLVTLLALTISQDLI